MSGNDEALREEFSALLDGALPVERQAELRALLERDEELRAEYEALRETVELVRGLPREGAPAELRERLRAPRPRGLAPLLRLAVPLAAAAVVLVAFVLNLQQTQPVESTEVAKDRSLETTTAAEPPAPASAVERDRIADTEELRRTVNRAREAKKEIADDKTKLFEETESTFEARAGLGSYLAQLESLDAPALRSHIASFVQAAAKETPPGVRTPAGASEAGPAAEAATADEGGAGGAGGARAPAEEDSEIQVAPFTSVVVKGREDARRVEALLLRAYEAPTRPVESLGAAKGAGEPDAGGKAGRTRRAQPAPRTPGDSIRLELQVTPEELAQIEAWLARVSVSGPPAGLAGTAATVVSGAVARQRLRVVIHVLAPAPTAPATPPAAAEGAKDR